MGGVVGLRETGKTEGWTAGEGAQQKVEGLGKTDVKILSRSNIANN